MTIHHRDTFTAADGVTLTVHVPEVGGGYSDFSRAAGTDEFEIISEHVRQPATWTVGAVRSNAQHALGQVHAEIGIITFAETTAIWTINVFASPTVFFNFYPIGYELRATYVPSQEDKSLKLYYRDSVQEEVIATLIASPGLARPTVDTKMVLEVRDNGDNTAHIRAVYDGVEYYNADHTPADNSILLNRAAGFLTYHNNAYVDNYLVEDLPPLAANPTLHFSRPV